MQVRILFGILSMLAALLALWVLGRDIAPPGSMRLAAGIEDGGYWQIAERYREALARDGIEVTLLVTGGAVENLDLLSSGEADAAILQGGLEVPAGIESLGAIFREPLFFFARTDAPVPANPGEWSGLRVAAGVDGSGTRAAFQAFLTATGLPQGAIATASLGGQEAADALRSGEIDIAFFVAPVMAPYLAPLLDDPRVRILDVDHLTAIGRRIGGASVTTLPTGSISLVPPLPREELPLLVLAAQLAGRTDLHPSLVDRLVTAARRIHSGSDAVTTPGTFPSARTGQVQMDPYARRLIEEGPSPLNDFLPYWVVAQINRFVILLLPILFLLVPLVRAAPALYRWRMRSRVYRHYAEIREIDAAARTVDDPGKLDALDTRLLAIDDEIAALRLPLPYREHAYTARLHVDLIRNRLRTLREHQEDGTPAISAAGNSALRR